MSVKSTMQFEIAAQPAAVVAALVAVEDLPTWSGPHKSVSVESRHADGRPHHVRADFGAVGLTDHQVSVMIWDGDARMTWTLTESTMQSVQTGSYTFTATPTGTRIDFELEIGPKVPLPGFIVKKVVKIAMDTASKGLTKYVASRTTSHADTQQIG